MAPSFGARLTLPIRPRRATLASRPWAMSEFPPLSTETGHARMASNTILALDLSRNETSTPLDSSVPLASNTITALDLASVNHRRIRRGPRGPLTERALLAHNLAYDGPSILFNWARLSSVAGAGRNGEQAPRPTPVPAYLYRTPVVPPMRRWFPSIVNARQRTRCDRMMLRAGVEVLYTQAALMADDKRLDWEKSFMGYFRWKPWSRQSGEELVKWAHDHKHDYCWSSQTKGIFEKASQSGYPHKKYYPAFEGGAVLDRFTYRIQCMLIDARIFNLVVARIHTDYYIVVPVGLSRPVYNANDFTPLEQTFISTWYPFSFLLLADLPGEDRYMTFRREFMRISDTLRGYYIERTPYWRGCSDRL
ncbi:hypothetical protein MGU_02416 [Metarhizium guizhouense ARSEF 977]|uniref:Uncharacterized protein n=1 Tax=Metarhizium guizhouense (strain ARSEF 977) TaxID=1276136 RepID=A0A0B4I9V0_METGA|nr:hypothetical protein MGU_02416 [Metarhizium guizhouense ARSEF 977]